MAKRRRSTRKVSGRRTGGYKRGSTARPARSQYAPARRAPRRARKSAPRQQRIVIEFAGAAPVREDGFGLSLKPAKGPRLKPRL